MPAHIPDRSRTDIRQQAVAAPATPHHRAPGDRSWAQLRRRSGFLALFAVLILACYAVAVLARSGSQPADGPDAGGRAQADGADRGEDRNPATASDSPLGDPAPLSPPGSPIEAAGEAGNLPDRAAATPQDRAGADSEGSAAPVAPPAGPGASALATTSTLLPVPVIFDTDAGYSIDGTLALAMLHAYDAAGSIDLLAVTANQVDADTVAYLDTIDTYFGVPGLPIGITADSGRQAGDDAYHHDIAVDDRFLRDPFDGSQAVDAIVLLRRQLAAQPDHSVVIIGASVATNLARLLESGPDTISPLPGEELVARKVKLLAITAGEFERRRPELHVAWAPQSARLMFRDWPTPIVISEWQVGVDLPFPGETLLPDPSNTEAGNHASPLLAAYIAHGASALQTPFPYHHPSFDLTTVLYAVESEAGFFPLTEPGEVTVDADAITHFTPGGHGRHRLLRSPETPERTQAVVDRFVELVTTTPPAR